MSFLAPFRVSREYVRVIANTVDKYFLEKKHNGRVVADKKRSMRRAGFITTRPLERVEIDNFLLDVHLVCPDTGRWLGRPWLTAAVDHYSGMVLGYYLSYASPSATSILGALRHGIFPKKKRPNKSEDEPNDYESDDEVMDESWPCFGIPDCIALDNGSDMTGFVLADVCGKLAIEMFFCPPRVPWYKGVIERFGRTINMRFIHWFPGTTLGKETEEGAPPPHKSALLTFDDFEELLRDYFVTVQNRIPRKNKLGTPTQRWLEGLEKWPVRLPDDENLLDALIGITEKRTLLQTGIQYENRFYANDALEMLWNTCPEGTKVLFRVNILDIRTINVFHPVRNAFFKVECITPEAWPLPLDFHLQRSAHAISLGLNPALRHDITIAENDLKKKIRAMSAKNKRKMLGKNAEFLRQKQDNAALELPINTSTKPLTSGESMLGLLAALQEDNSIDSISE